MDMPTEKNSEEQTSHQLDNNDVSTASNKVSNPVPFALHMESNGNKNQSDTVDEHVSNLPKTHHDVRAPYAQPVLDASKLNQSTLKRSSVDERIALVRERRLMQQKALEITKNPTEEEFQLRRAKDDAAYSKWEQTQDERKKKMEENREKEEKRRKEVEIRKKQHIDGEKKRAEAIVARTEQQATVVLRQKRGASIDRKKRWSWGAGGYGGGGSGGITYATAVDTAPGPFHYLDPSRMTKHRRQSGLGARRPLSMTASNLDLSQFMLGDGDKRNEDGGSGPVSYGSPSNSSHIERDDRFSKSPLLVGTAHMAFASGLRSYDSSPVSNTSKHSSPASTSRAARARSSDTRTKSKSSNNSVTGDGPTNKVSTRGRSPTTRRTEGNKKPKATTSPQLTEPTLLSARLLAPTKSSMARSKQAEAPDSASLPATSVRSRSNDRRQSKDQPSSARSDTSSNSSTTMSPRGPISTTPTSRTMGRTPSPSLYKQRSQKTPTLQSSSSPNLSQRQRGQSPQLRNGPRRAPSPALKTKESSATKESKTPSRGTSPARQQSPSTLRSSSASKQTPIRDAKLQPSKSTPPAIKQPLKQGITLGKKSGTSPVVLSKANPKKSKDQKAPSVTSAKPKAKEASKEQATSVKTNTDVAVMLAERDVELHDQPKSNKEEVSTVITDPSTTINNHTQQNAAKALGSTIEKESLSTVENEVVVEEVEQPSAEVKDEVFQSIKQANTDTMQETEKAEESEIINIEEKQPENTNEQPAEIATNGDAKEAIAENLEEYDLEHHGPSTTVAAVEPENIMSSNEESVITTPEASEAGTGQPDSKVEIPAPISEEVDVVIAPEVISPENEDRTNNENNDVVEKADVELCEKLVVEEKAEVAVGEDEKEQRKITKDLEGESTSVESSSMNTPSPVMEQAVEKSQEVGDKIQTQALEENQVTTHDKQPICEPKPEAAPVNETKKREKKLTPEEQAYKEAMAAKRKEAKEKREKEEQERQERKKLAAEESARRVEIARQMAEEAKVEEEKRLEEERRIQEEEEMKKKQEADELARKHEEFIKEQKERVEQRAKEEAEKARKERNLAAQKKEDERLQRKKRLEMIMRRTRGGDSPTPNADTSPSHTAPSGESSPSNLTPTGGRSPHNSLTPDRTESPAAIETQTVLSESESTSNIEFPEVNPVYNEAPKPLPHEDDTENSTNLDENEISTIVLSEMDRPNGSDVTSEVPEPILAFVSKINGAPEESSFVPVKDQNGRAFELDENSSKEGFTEQQYSKIQEVPTGNLLDL